MKECALDFPASGALPALIELAVTKKVLISIKMIMAQKIGLL